MFNKKLREELRYHKGLLVEKDLLIKDLRVEIANLRIGDYQYWISFTDGTSHSVMADYFICDNRDLVFYNRLPKDRAQYDYGRLITTPEYVVFHTRKQWDHVERYMEEN